MREISFYILCLLEFALLYIHVSKYAYERGGRIMLKVMPSVCLVCTSMVSGLSQVPSEAVTTSYEATVF